MAANELDIVCRPNKCLCTLYEEGTGAVGQESVRHRGARNDLP